MNERRIEDRLLCADLVEMIWTDDLGRRRRRVVNLEDISLSGVCLQSDGPLEAGTHVSINYGDGKLIGTVRHCKFREIGYFLGVELEDGCQWSTKHFRPQHLLDPKELMEAAISRANSHGGQAASNRSPVTQ